MWLVGTVLLNFKVHYSSLEGRCLTDQCRLVWPLTQSWSLVQWDLLCNQLVLKGVQRDVRISGSGEIGVVLLLIAHASICAIVWTASVGRF